MVKQRKTNFVSKASGAVVLAKTRRCTLSMKGGKESKRRELELLAEA